jgi:predicted anti-sigma-YlaC factor YlaD
MICSEVRDRVAPYLDGQLSEAEAWRVAEHLEACEACRRLMLGLGTQPLGHHPPAPVRPPEFWGSMDQAIEAACRRPVPLASRIRAWLSGPVTLSRWAVVLGVTLLAATIGLHLVRPSAPPPPFTVQAQGPPPPRNGAVTPVSHAPVRHHY